MSRSKKHPYTAEKSIAGAGGRGIAKSKRKMTRSVRHKQDRIVKRGDDPAIEKPRKYKDFWWERI